MYLNEQHKIKLLELCIHYFPETKMKIYSFSDGYKGHEVKFKPNSDDSENSTNVLMGFHQIKVEDGAIDYEENIDIHWYELAMCELSMRMYKDNYEKKMHKLFHSKKHVVDFLYDDYIEDYDINIRNHD